MSSNVTTADEIIKVLDDDSTFGFNEIRLSRRLNVIFSEDVKLKNTIDLFSFGSYDDYRSNKNDFIKLSERALLKLRQLTLLTEASKSNTFDYDTIQQKVGLSNINEFERLVTETAYKNLIKAKLFGREKILKIYTASGRDVLLNHEEDLRFRDVRRVSDLINSLSAFNERISAAFNYIDEVKQQNGCEGAPISRDRTFNQNPGSKIGDADINTSNNNRKRKIGDK